MKRMPRCSFNLQWGEVGAYQVVETDAKIQRQEIARGHVQGKWRGPG
jgi:hypothetical protein